jgi:hypothetical protein
LKINFKDSVIYDLETYPNVFTCSLETLNGDYAETFEISEFVDQREKFFETINWFKENNVVMIGFNNIAFDYGVLDFILRCPECTVEQIFQKAQILIETEDKFANNIWASDRLVPQLDLFKIHHFDNPAKSTNLKALQINMRSDSVLDLPFPVGSILTREQITDVLIPYNIHDVKETKQFALWSIDAINFRLSLMEQFGVDVLNWSDTKIGSKTMEYRLGKKVCYDGKVPRQTYRSQIALKDVIFPYVKFDNPEFQKVLDYLNSQVLKADELKEVGKNNKIKTKGVFTDLKATGRRIEFLFRNRRDSRLCILSMFHGFKRISYPRY